MCSSMDMKLGKFQGQSGVIAFVVLAIAIIVGVIVFSYFDSAASSIGLTTAGTAAVANVTTNTYSGFNIVSIAPIVLAAVVILAIVSLLARR